MAHVRPRDEWDALADINTDKYAPASVVRPTVVRDALVECEQVLGAGWVWNPGRWATGDGYVDFHTLLATMPQVKRLRAKQRIQTAQAVRMALGGDAVAGLIQATERDARGEVDDGPA